MQTSIRQLFYPGLDEQFNNITENELIPHSSRKKMVDKYNRRSSRIFLEFVFLSFALYYQPVFELRFGREEMLSSMQELNLLARLTA